MRAGQVRRRGPVPLGRHADAIERRHPAVHVGALLVRGLLARVDVRVGVVGDLVPGLEDRGGLGREGFDRVPGDEERRGQLPLAQHRQDARDADPRAVLAALEHCWGDLGMAEPDRHRIEVERQADGGAGHARDRTVRGLVRTLDPARPVAGGVVVRDGRIAALLDEEPPAAGAPCIVPGFCDAHVHFPSWAVSRLELDLRGAASLEDALELVARATDGHRGGWLRGRGWRDELWAEPASVAALDAVCGDALVALRAQDGHSLWCSSAALALAGGDLETPGGVVEPSGHPARGGGVAVPGAVHGADARREARCDARGVRRRGRGRRDGHPRHGRRAGRAGGVRGARRRRPAARLAERPDRAARRGA